VAFDLAHHRTNVGVDLPVGEANDTVALTAKPFRPFEVSQHDVVQSFVNVAIHLDHQPASVAGEIGDESADGRLASDMNVKLP